MTDFSSLLFIDIETVAAAPSYAELPKRLQALWQKKAAQIAPDMSVEESFEERAGIYAEFGKIVVIGIGFFAGTRTDKVLRVKSLASHNEKELLEEFATIVNKFGKNLCLVGHNAKEFDFPYLCRRMLVHRVTIPDVLQISNKKPWEIQHIDTMHMWKFGDYKSYTSLALLAALFDIPTSKDDIDGSEVNGVYYKEQNLHRIATYCSKDVILTAQLFLRLQNLEILKEEQIIVIED